jgi:hypothetical protein
MTGDAKALKLKDSLDGVLDAAGDKAEILAGIVGTMNWNSVDAWKELPEIVDNMGITFGDGGEALKEFIK